MPPPDRARPSRLPRDPDPPGHDGRPAVRWTDPRVAAAYSERDDGFERAVVWPAVAEALRPARPRRAAGRPDGTVLDLGCGTGALAHHLASTHWLRVHAADSSPALHRVGEREYRDAWLQRCLPDQRGRLPLRPGQCTAAVAGLVLTHLPHPAHIIGALTEARRVLRPGAPIAVVEPGTQGWDSWDGRDSWDSGDSGDYWDGGSRDGRADSGESDSGVQWGEPGRVPGEGEPFAARYRLRAGGVLETTAWRHSAGTLEFCFHAAGFAVDEVRPLAAVPGGPAPFLLLLCRAV